MRRSKQQHVPNKDRSAFDWPLTSTPRISEERQWGQWAASSTETSEEHEFELLRRGGPSRGTKAGGFD